MRGIEITERIKDAERSGAPAKFKREQILKLFKLACDDPKNYERPISHWELVSSDQSWKKLWCKSLRK